MFRPVLALMALASISACTSNILEGGVDAARYSAAEIEELGEKFMSLDVEEEDVTPVTTGSMTTEGAMVFTISEFEEIAWMVSEETYETYVGRMTLTADFDAETLSGSAGNFVIVTSSDEFEGVTAIRDADGTLTISGFTNLDEVYGFVDGVLSDEGTPVFIDATLQGSAFVYEGETYIGGQIYSDLRCFECGSAIEERFGTEVDGAFLTQKFD